MALTEASRSISPQEEMVLPDSIMSLPEQSGSIVSEREYELLGGTELLLSNGMRVFFKSTPFQNDEILVTGIAHGGMTEVRVRMHGRFADSSPFCESLYLCPPRCLFPSMFLVDLSVSIYSVPTVRLWHNLNVFLH